MSAEPPTNPIVTPGLTGNAAIALAARWLQGADVPDPARDARLLPCVGPAVRRP